VLPGGAGVRIAVRVAPRARTDAIEGWERDAAGREYLKLRLRAVAEDGKANAALIDLLSRALGVTKANIEIAGGARSRMKTVELRGDPKELTRRLASGGAG